MTLAHSLFGPGTAASGMFALTAMLPKPRDLFEHAAALLDGRDPRDARS